MCVWLIEFQVLLSLRHIIAAIGLTSHYRHLQSKVILSLPIRVVLWWSRLPANWSLNFSILTECINHSGLVLHAMWLYVESLWVIDARILDYSLSPSICILSIGIKGILSRKSVTRSPCSICSIEHMIIYSEWYTKYVWK